MENMQLHTEKCLVPGGLLCKANCPNFQDFGWVSTLNRMSPVNLFFDEEHIELTRAKQRFHLVEAVVDMESGA